MNQAVRMEPTLPNCRWRGPSRCHRRGAARCTELRQCRSPPGGALSYVILIDLDVKSAGRPLDPDHRHLRRPDGDPLLGLSVPAFSIPESRIGDPRSDRPPFVEACRRALRHHVQDRDRGRCLISSRRGPFPDRASRARLVRSARLSARPAGMPYAVAIPTMPMSGISSPSASVAFISCANNDRDMPRPRTGEISHRVVGPREATPASS